MPSALDIFDYCQTVGVSVALLVTIPPAGFVYFKLIFGRKFSARYIFKLIAINGITALLNTLTWLFIVQLSTAVNAFLGDLFVHSALFIALNRTIAMLSFGRRNLQNFNFRPILSSSLALSSCTLPAVLDFRFTTMIYSEISFGGESILIPDVIVTNEFFRILSYVIRVVVSLATLLLNIFLCGVVARERRNISVSQKQRVKAEKGLVVTSLIAYGTYMIYFANNLITRYVLWVRSMAVSRHKVDHAILVSYHIHSLGSSIIRQSKASIKHYAC